MVRIYNPEELQQSYFGSIPRPDNGNDEYGGGVQRQRNVKRKDSVLGRPITFGAGAGRGTPRGPGLGPEWARILGFDPTDAATAQRRRFGGALLFPRNPQQEQSPQQIIEAQAAMALGDVLARAAAQRPGIDPRSGLPVQRAVDPGRQWYEPGPTPEIINILADLGLERRSRDDEPRSTVGDITRVGR